LASQKVSDLTPIELNASLNLWKYTEGGSSYIDFESDKEAVRQYFLQEVNPSSQHFYSLKEKLEFLFDNEYYEPEVWEQYGLKRVDGEIVRDEGYETIKNVYNVVYEQKHRFATYLGALKFYTSYAMKTFDGATWLERYEDRVVANALLLGRGNPDEAVRIALEIVQGHYQPATPTFSNAGKSQAGAMVSCFLSRIEDSFESIGKSVTTALQLSKRGGGVALCLTNIREAGAPIKKIENMSSGVIPIMKILEDSFSYADQLGTRAGAGAVYLSIHHPDFLQFLDTKRENADEKIRIKTLSLGVILTDKVFEAARNNEDIYQFSPYSIMQEYGKAMSDISINDMYDELVDNPRIRKSRINARKALQTIAEIQFESGYPYIMFEDTVNRVNPIEGRVSMSNLCVTADTRILTAEGYMEIGSLYMSQRDFDVIVDTRARDMDMDSVGLSVERSTKAMMTARDAEVFEVQLSNDYSIKATSWHKFYVLRDDVLHKIPLAEVIVGDDLLVIPRDLPNFNTQEDLDSINPVDTETVLSIEFHSRQDVYDVTVENGNSVIFNGIATGNCSEILQVSEAATFDEQGNYAYEGRDISCNLGSMNIAKVMLDGSLPQTVATGIRALTAVSDLSDLKIVPTVRRGNELSHAIGLGQMNLHGFFIHEGWDYGSQISVDFTNAYFMAVAYYAYRESMLIAKETGKTFYNFEKSRYADPEYLEQKYSNPEVMDIPLNIIDVFKKYNMELPTVDMWTDLAEDIAKYGLYNQNLQAVPPTGSISYLANSTASIHPITDKVETRKEGRLGRVYYPQPFVTNENFHKIENAYDVGPEKLVDIYAAATYHVDQGLSLTMFFKDSATTRDINKAQLYAWKKGIKTIYYIRLSKSDLAGTGMAECVSCAL